MSDKRVRNFNLLLYPDNPSHNLAIMELQSLNYRACGIRHNKDCYEEDSDNHSAGEQKKEHFHFVLKFDNSRSASAVAKELEIEERFVQPCENFKASAKYLLHYGDDNKYQYSKDELVGTLKSDVIKLLDDKPSETSQILDIYTYLVNQTRVVDVTELGIWCAQNGYWGAFRRSYSFMSDLCYKHNEKFYQC